MKIDTRTGCGPAAAAAAIPCSHAAGRSAPPPNTASARPPVRAMKERRESPVPAGVGIPDSIGRSP